MEDIQILKLISHFKLCVAGFAATWCQILSQLLNSFYEQGAFVQKCSKETYYEPNNVSLKDR